MMQFEGMDELIRKLNQIGEKGKQIEEKALNEAADMLLDKISVEVPYDTGQLEKSIEKSPVKEGRIEIGPSAKGFYGRFIEFGYYNKRAKRQIPPRPWLAPTFERNSTDVQRIMADSVKRELGI